MKFLYKGRSGLLHDTLVTHPGDFARNDCDEDCDAHHMIRTDTKDANCLRCVVRRTLS